MLLNNSPVWFTTFPMKRTLFIASVLISLATTAQAACFADYKAKKDDPLRLHYGVVQLPDRACANKQAAERVTQQRISQDGWTLLSIVSIFDEGGLDQRKSSAGQYFLRF